MHHYYRSIQELCSLYSRTTSIRSSPVESINKCNLDIPISSLPSVSLKSCILSLQWKQSTILLGPTSNTGAHISHSQRRCRLEPYHCSNNYYHNVYSQLGLDEHKHYTLYGWGINKHSQLGIPGVTECLPTPISRQLSYSVRYITLNMLKDELWWIPFMHSRGRHATHK